MIKISIIVPIYNVEQYLNKCLDSIINQSYNNFEVILINDGSLDDSKKICDEFVKNDKRFRYFEQANSGLSSARNRGVSEATGDYLLFVDSDDYLSSDLLKELNDNLDDNYDLIRFQVNYDINGNLIQTKGCQKTMIFQSGNEAFKEIVNYEIVEAAWCYLYNKSYYMNNNYFFKPGTVHEDYGLIPLVIMKANKIKIINYYGYNYVIRDNSIMTDNNYEKVLKKANDFLEHFKYLLNESNNIKGDLTIFKSFIANSIILKSTTLKGNDYKKYIDELKKLKAFDMILDDSIGRKIKKYCLKINPKLYYKLRRG